MTDTEQDNALKSSMAYGSLLIQGAHAITPLRIAILRRCDEMRFLKIVEDNAHEILKDLGVCAF